MLRLCPPTQELIAFIAVARHLSITAAAKELSLTQGAISKKILNLELFLNTKLFERVRQRVVLTDVGKQYLVQIKAIVHSLEQATLKVKSGTQLKPSIKISSVPTFAAQWLIPKIAKFLLKHPQIDITFVPYSAQTSETLTSDAMPDLFIKYGEGIWPGLRSSYLIGKELVAVVGKGSSKPLSVLSDIQNATLLHHHNVPHAWYNWNQSIGKINDFDAYRGQRFDQFSMMIEAVQSGMGVALIPRCLIQKEMKSKQVAVLFKSDLTLWNGYYLCTPEHLPVPAIVTQLIDWLNSQVK